MEFYEMYFKWWFWVSVAIIFVYFTLVEWRYYLFDGWLDFFINFLISVIVSFLLSAAIFGFIYLVYFFFTNIFGIEKYLAYKNIR